MILQWYSESIEKFLERINQTFIYSLRMAAIPFPQGKNHKKLNLCTTGYASTHFYQMLTRTLDHELTILDFESTFYGCIWPNFKQFSYGRYKVKGKGSKSPKKPKQLRKTQALSTCSREPLTYLAPGNTFSILVKPCVVAAGAHHTSSCSTIILFLYARYCAVWQTWDDRGRRRGIVQQR